MNRAFSPVKLTCIAVAVLAIGGSAYALQSDNVSYVAGSSQKICQLTGETDLQRGQPTTNRTETNFGLKGCDLGSSFEHNGKVYFLFGDTFPKTYGARADALDSIAYSTDTNPEDCVALTFLTNSDGVYRPPIVDTASYPPGTPPIGQYGCQVPVHGFSANGTMYVFFSDLDQCNVTTNSLERSILASSTDDGQTFQYVCEVSTSKFINISAAIVTNADVPGLPQTSGQGVLLWGSGPYRKSSPCLAFLPLNTVTNRITWRYFAGLDSLRQPTWSSNQQDSADLFSCYSIGELSVTWNPFLCKWLMLYNCGDVPRGINFRVADQPWGPWSNTQVLFDPWADGGYCHFMHVAWANENCDSVYDNMFGYSRTNDWGGEYGPYVISRYVTGNATNTTIYFAMSTWNPYEAVLMKSNLKMVRSPTAFENWQLQYFGCTYCPQAQPGADPLGKGIVNSNQFLLGLNPTNPASVFRITSVAQTSSNLVIAWKTAGPSTNVVQATGTNATYNASNFYDLSGLINITNIGDTVTNYLDPSGTNTYYRIRFIVTSGSGGTVVISQVYGGGGNSGATYKNDFVELYNAGMTTVDLSTYAVQYASASGSSWQETTLSGTVQPGHYYLIQEAAGSGGTQNLPTPEATGTISMSATAGKVALTSTTTLLSGSNPVGGPTVVDFVGYGSTANAYEGSGPAPAPSNTTADLRANGGATDTNDNAADFATGAPNPRD